VRPPGLEECVEPALVDVLGARDDGAGARVAGAHAVDPVVTGALEARHSVGPGAPEDREQLGEEDRVGADELVGDSDGIDVETAAHLQRQVEEALAALEVGDGRRGLVVVSNVGHELDARLVAEALGAVSPVSSVLHREEIGGARALDVEPDARERVEAGVAGDPDAKAKTPAPAALEEDEALEPAGGRVKRVDGADE
jgi:hypothetical protein